MLKFAFIFETGMESGENFEKVYKNLESYSLLKGIPTPEQGLETAKDLVAKGFTVFNFCGSFDNSMMNEYRSILGEEIEVEDVNYFPAEKIKFESLEEGSEYGIIVVISGTTETTCLELLCDTCNTYAYFTGNLNMAKAAAKELLERGVHFIELCSWFDEDMTKEIIKTVEGKVPVGSAGI